MIDVADCTWKEEALARGNRHDMSFKDNSVASHIGVGVHSTIFVPHLPLLGFARGPWSLNRDGELGVLGLSTLILSNSESLVRASSICIEREATEPVDMAGKTCEGATRDGYG